MTFINFLKNHLLTCPSKAFLHIECPGCGMQRSFLCLMEGNIKGSLYFHPAAIPMLVLLFFVPLHLIFKFRYGDKIIVMLQLIVAIITGIFYIYKIINHKIFI
jgi:hypothetical protein